MKNYLVKKFSEGLDSFIQKTLKILLIASVLTIGFSTSGCGIKKKRLEKEKIENQRKEAEARLREKINNTKAELNSLLNNKTMSLEDKEKALAAIKARKINDPEVLNLIKQLDDQIANGRKTIDNNVVEEVKLSPEAQLKKSFPEIAKAGSDTQANQIIEKVLKLCANDNIPVLVLISNVGGVKDYDKPTTISKYLNYIKDQKKFDVKFDNIIFDNNGKIKRVELRK